MSDDGIDPVTATVAEAQSWLRDRVNDGERCPVCTQWAQTYRRTINAGMARSLVEMWRVGGLTPVHVPTQIGARSREEGKLAYWELAEPCGNAVTPDTAPDVAEHFAGRDRGWWRVTAKGRDFALGTTTVPQYAVVFDGRVLGHDGKPITIRDALGTRFDLDALLAGVASTT